LQRYRLLEFSDFKSALRFLIDAVWIPFAEGLFKKAARLVLYRYIFKQANGQRNHAGIKNMCSADAAFSIWTIVFILDSGMMQL
jgi:uncharacterized membrane-anchored protein